jgi:hypothetical protein
LQSELKPLLQSLGQFGSLGLAGAQHSMAPEFLLQPSSLMSVHPTKYLFKKKKGSQKIKLTIK